MTIRPEETQYLELLLIRPPEALPLCSASDYPLGVFVSDPDKLEQGCQLPSHRRSRESLGGRGMIIPCASVCEVLR
jgi:hypothetical protein